MQNIHDHFHDVVSQYRRINNRVPFIYKYTHVSSWIELKRTYDSVSFSGKWSVHEDANENCKIKFLATIRISRSHKKLILDFYQLL